MFRPTSRRLSARRRCHVRRRKHRTRRSVSGLEELELRLLLSANIDSVTSSLGNDARFLTDDRLPAVFNTYEASISGDTQPSKVVFELGGIPREDTDFSDNSWAVQFNISDVAPTDQLFVKAYDGAGTLLDDLAHAVDVIALPPWMQDEDQVSFDTSFDRSTGYTFDVDLRHYEQSIYTPSDWVFEIPEFELPLFDLADKRTGFEVGSRFELSSSLEGQVNADDYKLAFEGWFLDDRIFEAQLDAGAEGTLGSVEGAAGDVEVEGSIDYGISAAPGFNSILEFSGAAFTAWVDPSLSVEFPIASARIPLLSMPGGLDVKLGASVEASIESAKERGDAMLQLTATVEAGDLDIRSVLQPSIQGTLTGSAGLDILAGAAEAKLELSGTVEQALIGLYDEEIWAGSAPGSLFLELSASYSTGWGFGPEDSLDVFSWEIASWDFLEKSGESTTPDHSAGGPRVPVLVHDESDYSGLKLRPNAPDVFRFSVMEQTGDRNRLHVSPHNNSVEVTIYGPDGEPVSIISVEDDVDANRRTYTFGRVSPGIHEVHVVDPSQNPGDAPVDYDLDFDFSGAEVADRIWLGTESNDWDNDENWGGGGVPTSDNNVLIATGLAEVRPGTTARMGRSRILGATLSAVGGKVDASSLTNDGTVSIDDTTELVQDGATYINRGQINIAEGATLHNTGAFNFTQESGSLNVDGNFQVVGSNFHYENGTITGTPQLIDSALTFGPEATEDVAFALRSNCTFSGEVLAGQELLIEGGSVGDDAKLTIADGLVNSGTIVLTSSRPIYSATLEVVNGSLTNTATGVISVEQGGAGGRTISADLINHGVVNLGRTTVLPRNGAEYINRGQIDIAEGATLHNTGAFNFTQESGSLNVDGNFQVVGSNFHYENGTITGTPQLIDSALNFGPEATEDVTFMLRSNCTFSGEVLAGQVLLIEGGSVGDEAKLTVADGLVNSGTIVLNSTRPIYSATLEVTGGPLTNTATGVINVEQGDGGGRSISAKLVNHGTLNINADSHVGRSGASHVNSGRLVVTGSDSAIIVIGDLFTNTSVGAVEGVGTLNVSGTKLKNEGSFQPGGDAVGLLQVIGDYQQSSSGNLEVQFSAISPDPVHDQLRVTGAVVLGGEIKADFSDGLAPEASDTFVVLENDADDPVDGAVSLVTDVGKLRVDTEAGDGNDVAVTAASGALSWQNSDNIHDVNDDGNVSALDALLVINHLNRNGDGELPELTAAPDAYIDVTGDNSVSALDALRVINELNRESSASGEQPISLKFDDAAQETPGLLVPTGSLNANVQAPHAVDRPLNDALLEQDVSGRAIAALSRLPSEHPQHFDESATSSELALGSSHRSGRASDVVLPQAELEAALSAFAEDVRSSWAPAIPS